MKNKVLVFIFVFMIVCISLPFILGATSFVIEKSYDSLNASLPGIYKTDSIVLRITTSVESSCSYGDSPSSLVNDLGVYGLTHETYLENLEEGFHKYYILCGVGDIKEISFTTSIPIYATIQLSENPPLKAGKYTIDLITSKTTLGTPTLEYSFDEIVYKPISLKGSGKNWEGNLIIPDTLGEAVCSFRFSAQDLSGQTGTKIIGDNLFIIDTSSPSAIGIINAVGYEGQIRLDWFFDEDVKEFNIYKSENPQVDYTEFYKSTNKDYFYDNDVTKGKTYYYRIAGVDEAGNIGDLSKEVYATALLSNYTTTSGLNPKLVGKVDNSVAEINSVIQNINGISALIDLKEEKEKNLFKDLKLDKDLDDAITELNSLKRDIESYKLQDLSEIELDNKLASATLKLNIIKKKVPEDITITGEKEIVREFTEENLQKAFLEYFPNSEDSYNKEISDTLKIIKDKNLQIKGNFYGLEILYLDGTKKQITLIEETITPQIEDIPDFSFVLIVPKEIAEQSSELKFMNLDYSVVKDDPVLSFNQNTEKIIYYLNKEMGLDSLDDIIITPIKLPSADTNESKITGNSILESVSKGSLGIIMLVIFALALVVYFLRLRSSSSIKPVLRIIEDIKKSKSLLKEGKEEEARNLYQRVKEEYKNLSDKDKRTIMNSIEKMREGV